MLAHVTISDSDVGLVIVLYAPVIVSSVVCACDCCLRVIATSEYNVY